jgi:acyl carrier protein
MQFVGINTGILKGGKGKTRAEIVSAVERIVAAVADEHGLVEARDNLTLRSNLHDDLGMDEVDLIEIIFRAEEHFGTDQLREKEARLAPVQDPKEVWKELPVQEQPESTLVGPDQDTFAEEVAELP